ncbi:MAG: sigma-54 interaction domain-containing protein, partial [Myxococcales bacterium]
RSPTAVRLCKRIEPIATSESAVLIIGESGTGKELVARSLHELGPRRERPFVAVNCAAFPETLLEAELFGHERGAFTGAVRKRDGRFKAADGGTLFLDEVAEMSPSSQAKLLRVLQEGTIEPLGTNAPIQVNVRILSATHRDLKKAMADGTFREDLFYRLNVIDVYVAPLRERRGDLPLLVEHFMQGLLPPRAPPPRISPAAWAALNEYPFPGNVRELQHAVEHALVLSRGAEIRLEHLPASITGGRQEYEDGTAASSFLPLAVALREYEREYLLRALAAADGKKTRAAELLGISRKNLWEKLKGHGIVDSDFEESPP